jgi:hypothetical protein
MNLWWKPWARPKIGRVGRRVRYVLIAADGEPVPFREFVDWTYDGRRPWRWPIYRALHRYGTNVRRGWWAPNPELLRQIKGE